MRDEDVNVSTCVSGRVLEVLRDATEVARRAVDIFIKSANEAIKSKGKFSVALSGGSTPKRLYELLARENYSSQIDWQRVHVFWSDERCVPPDDEQSNYRMANEALLKHIPIPPNQIHRMHGEDEPQTAAENYEAELKNHFGNDMRFDLILLGMGDDGHTASLFPNTTAIDEKERLVAAPFVEKFNSDRITFTFKTINSAAKIIFLITGASKAETLKLVFGEPRKDLPASLIKPTDGELIWLIDESSAMSFLSKIL
jgi:6-phosphogluconolactonase